MKKKHRNSQKRIYFEDAVYFVSCKTEGGHPFFKEKIFCDIFVENLRICKKLKGFYLYAWVLVYNHFHLLIRPSDKCNISKVMHCLKRNISRDVNFVMGYNKYDNHPSEGADNDPRLRKIVLTKWISQSRYKLKHPNQNRHSRFHWQKSYHDHFIRNDGDFDHHMDYIIWNPEKHKMPDGWPYVFTNEEYRDLTDSPL